MMLFMLICQKLTVNFQQEVSLSNKALCVNYFCVVNFEDTATTKAPRGFYRGGGG